MGGGPNKKYNQVGIESNVRYMERLLPSAAPRRILFADGDPQTPSVLFEDQPGKEQFRKPKIAQIDGSSSYANVQAELQTLGGQLESAPGTPALLYFTGHGSPNAEGNVDNNAYDLWGGHELTVKELARSLAPIPKSTPIVVVMVECFSGSFANLMYEGGDPKGDLTGRRLCGFFASVAERMSAGCTPTTDESEYHDFTSYFFAALTGTDRVGRKVTGADYDHNGRVGMNEAFAYTLINDDSIDTPVCTSDAFLRRFVTTSDADIFAVPYSRIHRWASPAQRAALDALSTYLKATGEDRVKSSYDEMVKTRIDTEKDHDVRLYRFVRLAKSVVLAHNLRSSSDEPAKRAFEALIKEESGNPLSPK
ncbi:hypothetical protein OP10G_0666 [Fimbriimonas ginsengisoli Gsoil 348]|uniref:Uncharacterized protein n=1 Tax=Fimbriimonas ginsengisoli Gsoil 348 TaxID=661478 RepID=A0A068NR31_FIMGI|nr:hypothetical protein OP10G_0666 [Fimbriimonas ginsengisoli Gsoil 348]